MRSVIINIISIYQFITRASGTLKNRCVFYPSCSEYSKEALLKYGTIKGLGFSIKRIIRCHPWQKNHIDIIT